MREEVDGLLGLNMIVGPRGVKSRKSGRRKAEGNMSRDCCIAVELWRLVVNGKTSSVNRYS
jgi:hypothetical protein